MEVTIYTRLADLGELKRAIKTAGALFVWVNWEGDDGDYIQVAKSSFLRSIGADTPYEESGDGGRPDWTPVRAELRGNDVYVS